MKKGNRHRRSVLSVLLLAVILGTASLAGCGSSGGEKEALEFTVAEESEIPEELKTIIEEKKISPFQLTYQSGENLYLVVGLGTQETGGYSISVKNVYLQDGSICLETESMGPSQGENTVRTPSCPYIVVKLPYREEPVVFL